MEGVGELGLKGSVGFVSSTSLLEFVHCLMLIGLMFFSFFCIAPLRALLENILKVCPFKIIINNKHQTSNLNLLNNIKPTKPMQPSSLQLIKIPCTVHFDVSKNW